MQMLREQLQKCLLDEGGRGISAHVAFEQRRLCKNYFPRHLFSIFLKVSLHNVSRHSESSFGHKHERNRAEEKINVLRRH
jgi:hypothetical protein